ncbi:MAG: DUF4145 domain-containing protein [Crocosphaera sp.]|nr:DUF4145 domain-containing protein [Crocosphaera sp.]
MNQIIKQRLQDLEKNIIPIENSINSEDINQGLLIRWKVQIQDLILKIAGKNSSYYQEFISIKDEHRWGEDSSRFKDWKHIFYAFKEDFESGYLISFEALIQADVFDSELEQAEILFKKGYLTASAVIAGVVLETTIRKLCDKNSIPHDSFDKMNSDLVKVGIYNKLDQKRLIALYDIRNSAAHGLDNQFSKRDVEDMIRDVKRFVEDKLDKATQ